MKNLSFTQEFFLCALKPQGSTTLTNSTESSTCLLAGGLLELLMDCYISIDDKKKMFVNKELSSDKMYLTPVYELIKNNKPMKIETIAEKYAFDFERPDELFKSVGRSIVEDGYVIEESNQGLFKNKVRFLPNESEVTKVVEKLRAEFLEDGNVSDEAIVLGALLNKSGLIKKYFSKYELQKLNDRLKEIKQSEAGTLIKNMVDYIDTWIAIMIAIISTSVV
ncbi:GPP34 family phosphoprotein [Ruminiclostridium papyrosolvens]|uniref:Golgi phosphoprotein 3-like protein n=1 Tax=Ruminiclostridium papyrosolvens C7 TaxID=1330534 RepID=U4R1Y4_9FIRM|nr:GPP34 family phosphoprotein [Ruminiclostridium papyrosolvens]EPR11464.1 Golgi phosphoprotein 3-like protein [Ruminiclostridium papyrosolvens C7]